MSLKSILEINPVIQILCKALRFSSEDTSDKIVNTFYTKDTLKNYFGKNIHLPINKFSAIDKRNIGRIDCSCVGDIYKDNFDKNKVLKYLRGISEKTIIGKEILLNYSEFYQYNTKDFSDTGSCKLAENYVESIIAEAWYLEEQTILNLIQ